MAVGFAGCGGHRMRKLFLMSLALFGVGMCFADAQPPSQAGMVATLNQDLARQTTELNEALDRKDKALAELERRKNSGASVEQISQIQLSVQALSKLATDAKSRVDTTQNKLHVLQAQS